jgi:tetratricopeptide (TPR) repeat protein
VRGWIRYGQPGRLYVWLDSHQRNIEDLTEAENALAYPLICAFDAIFKVTETGIVKKFKASVYDNTLEEVLKSMQQVDESSIDKLDEVLIFCEAQAEQDEFYRSLGLFILGYFNSLRGQLDDAYDAWDMVEHDKLREQAQISALTLALSQQDYARALSVLERLCVKQQAYLTIYANILITLGQQTLAIEVLQTYLQKVPEDIAAHLQLAQLLLALGRQEVAREQLEKLHQQSPTNPLIQRLLLESGGKVREDLTMTFV